VYYRQSENAERLNWAGTLMLAIVAEIFPLATTRVGIVIAQSVRVKIEKIGYKLEHTNYCQYLIFMSFLRFLMR
jgi:hypothetical protein